jgi:hypothetical protein
MSRSTFTPVFRDDVQIIVAPTPPVYPQGLKLQVNPQLCLTEESAKELAEILKDLNPTIVQLSPVGQLGQIFSVSADVPGLQFPDGATMNAAPLAMWWVRTVDPSAQAMCRMEIAQGSRELQALKDLGREA